MILAEFSDLLTDPFASSLLAEVDLVGLLKASKGVVLVVVAILLAIALISAATALLADDEADEMRTLLRSAPLIDGHNDVPWQIRSRFGNDLSVFDFRDTSGLERAMHTDLPRLALSGLGGQFWSVYIPTSLAGPGAARAVFEQIDVARRLIAKHPDRLELVTDADGLVAAAKAGRVASLFGLAVSLIVVSLVYQRFVFRSASVKEPS